mmetsp:Transcript_7579/g.30794  ORF Transcript_7579/g.30794 Transcript_7579/m.30794 type:complete len:349 (-) Transcript_7579:1219-2265(-)
MDSQSDTSTSSPTPSSASPMTSCTWKRMFMRRCSFVMSTSRIPKLPPTDFTSALKRRSVTFVARRALGSRFAAADWNDTQSPGRGYASPFDRSPRPKGNRSISRPVSSSKGSPTGSRGRLGSSLFALDGVVSAGASVSSASAPAAVSASVTSPSAATAVSSAGFSSGSLGFMRQSLKSALVPALMTRSSRPSGDAPPRPPRPPRPPPRPPGPLPSPARRTMVPKSTSSSMVSKTADPFGAAFTRTATVRLERGSSLTLKRRSMPTDSWSGDRSCSSLKWKKTSAAVSHRLMNPYDSAKRATTPSSVSSSLRSTTFTAVAMRSFDCLCTLTWKDTVSPVAAASRGLSMS